MPINYQVLARKWRPKQFAQVLGQTHVVQALTNALTQQRLHHAYLLTGTRGVGKTTIARILAKCLNCDTGITATPCGTCTPCQEIDNGSFADLLEIDAASRTKVEETRELLSNVPYAPIKGRYKVYLIDEVHMLSTHSFNALLKTLEEPPAHALFILATTEADRIPPTVRSRCLQFHLKAMPVESILTQLTQILTQEQLQSEPAALAQLAQAANGSMRDALSLLDQAIGFCAGPITTAAMHQMLGTAESPLLFELLSGLANQNPEQLFSTTATLAEQGADFVQVLDALLRTLHQVAFVQQGVTLQPSEVENQPALSLLASQLSAADVQLYYQIGVLGQRDLPWAPTPKIGLEMTLLKMLAFRPQQGPVKVSSPQQKPAVAEKPLTPEPIVLSAPVVVEPPPPAAVITPPVAVTAAATEMDWSTLFPQLKLTGMTQILASYCCLAHYEPNQLQLLVDPSQGVLCNKTQQERIEAALTAHFQRPMTITLTMANASIACPARVNQQQHLEKTQQAELHLTQDPKIHALVEAFNANIETGSLILDNSVQDKKLNCT